MADLIAQVTTTAVLLLLMGVIWRSLESRIDSKVDRAYCKPTHDAASRTLGRIEKALDNLDRKVDSLTEGMARRNGEDQAHKEGTLKTRSGDP